MIITESFKINDRDFIRTYSDSGFMIHGGSPEGNYTEATDPAELNRTYIETNIPIEEELKESSSEAEEIVNILTGEG